MAINYSKIPTPVLITGAYGMLGSDLVEICTKHFGASNVFATDYDTLDITNLEKVNAALSEKKPKLVINAAAYTDVDKAETEREKAFLINTTGPKVLATACAAKDIKLVHFTTDYVFSGEGNTPWVETDKPNPPKPNYYGETKLWGEQEVAKFEKNLILRVQWLYGKKRDRFTTLKDKKVFTPFMDQYGAPVSTEHLCQVLMEMLSLDAKGLYHFAYDDYTTWAGVYEFVKKELNLSTELIPKKSAEVKLPATRPLFGAMSNKKLLALLGRDKMGSWKDHLSAFLKK